MHNPYPALTDEQLLEQISDCAIREKEANAQAEPLRAELVRRQVETGETTIKHNGWQSTLTKEKVSAAWVAREYGYPKEEIPPECFDEVMKPELNAEKVVGWLQDQGHEIRPSFTISVGREKAKTLTNRKF